MDGAVALLGYTTCGPLEQGEIMPDPSSYRGHEFLPDRIGCGVCANGYSPSVSGVPRCAECPVGMSGLPIILILLVPLTFAIYKGANLSEAHPHEEPPLPHDGIPRSSRFHCLHCR